MVLGHVDAGKSTLMGRLLADLGVVTQKQVCCSAAQLGMQTRVHGSMHAAGWARNTWSRRRNTK